MNMHKFRIVLLLVFTSALPPLATAQAGDKKSSDDTNDYPYLGVDEATAKKVQAIKRAEAAKRFEKAVAEATRISDANAAEAARRLKKMRRAAAAKKINRSTKKKTAAKLDRNAAEILRLKKLIEEAKAAKKAALKKGGTADKQKKTTTKQPGTKKTTDAEDDYIESPYIGVTPEVAKRVAAMKQAEARKKKKLNARSDITKDKTANGDKTKNTVTDTVKKQDKTAGTEDDIDPPYIGVTDDVAKKVAAMKKKEAQARAEALKRIETALAAAKKISDANQRESEERLKHLKKDGTTAVKKTVTTEPGTASTPAPSPAKTTTQLAQLTQKSDEEIRQSLERDFWHARFGRHPLDKSRFVCFVESKPVIFFDGESNTRLKLVATKNDLYAITDSNIDSSYTNTGISVDRSERIKFDLVRKKTSVIFKNYTRQYIDTLSKGYYATVTLGFWPSWPKTRPLSVNVSLLGFNKAYNKLANCKSM